MSNRDTGRTFWDWLSEQDGLLIFLVVAGVLVGLWQLAELYLKATIAKG